MHSIVLTVIFCFILLGNSTNAHAEKTIKGVVKGTSLTGYSVSAISDDGKSITTPLINNKFSIVPPGKKVSLTLIQPNGKVLGPIVAVSCSNSKKRAYCSQRKVVTSFRPGASFSAKVREDFALLSTFKTYDTYTKTVVKDRVVAAIKGRPYGAGKLGQAKRDANGKIIRIRRVAHTLDTKAPDKDKDGIPEEFDIDDDGDGILDNYDTNNTPSSGGNSTALRLFSNLKLGIDESLNINATGSLSLPLIDNALSNAQTLAIPVLGSLIDTTELDCGTLKYCSKGGSGKDLQSMKIFPDEFDTDGDGFGTIVKGPTGDFQLKTGAITSTIGAGDTLIEKITSSTGSFSEISGMLNFIFHSTPAVKEITTSLGTIPVDYTLTTGRQGSANHCIEVPASGEVTIELTGWRPQRPGIIGAGEASYMDIGSSLFTIDIPNSPCTLSGGVGCPGQGPGNCSAASYSESDANLTISSSGMEGIQDIKGDIASNPSNTFKFTINISTCLAATKPSAVLWSPGETLFVDLQARSIDGDNAAQKFCFVRKLL